MHKKKAFTLMELLVVVIVLGVLGAVAAPKLSRVLETRKTAEAEEMLSALRTEQEKRCILGKNYTADAAKVPVVAAAARSKNYTYSLKETGAEAARAEYTLKMPSYKDGRMCCEGEGCAKLNKNYIACSAIPADDECKAGDMPCVDCSCAAYAQANACECSPSASTCCSSAHSEGASGSEACECGSVGGKWHCDSDTGYSWVLNLTGSCAEKPEDEENTCSDGTKQHRSYECVNGGWSAGAWDKECPAEKKCDNSHKEGDPVNSFTFVRSEFSGNMSLTDQVSVSIVGGTNFSSYGNVPVQEGDLGRMIVSGDCSVNECPTKSKYWHCGEDTDYQWKENTKTVCISKPKDRTKECEQGTGTLTARYTCTSNGWVLGEYEGECSEEQDCDESQKPPTSPIACNGCGTQTMSVECDKSRGEWVVSGISPCTKTEEECACECDPGQTTEIGGKTCPEGRGYKQVCLLVLCTEAPATDSFGNSSGSSLNTVQPNLAMCEQCTWLSGRYCGQDCKWHDNPSCSGGGGGGGGGSMMEGDCTTWTQRYVTSTSSSEYLDVTYVDCGNGPEVLGAHGHVNGEWF